MLKFQQKENGVLEKEKVMELILQGKEVIAKEKTSWRQEPIKRRRKNSNGSRIKQTLGYHNQYTA